MGKYSEDKVVKELERKHDIRISEKQIAQLAGDTAKGDVGIHSKGKIDFLVNYCNYVHFFVKKF